MENVTFYGDFQVNGTLGIGSKATIRRTGYWTLIVRVVEIYIEMTVELGSEGHLNVGKFNTSYITIQGDAKPKAEKLDITSLYENTGEYEKYIKDATMFDYYTHLLAKCEFNNGLICAGLVDYLQAKFKV